MNMKRLLVLVVAGFVVVVRFAGLIPNISAIIAFQYFTDSATSFERVPIFLTSLLLSIALIWSIKISLSCCKIT